MQPPQSIVAAIAAMMTISSMGVSAYAVKTPTITGYEIENSKSSVPQTNVYSHKLKGKMSVMLHH